LGGLLTAAARPVRILEAIRWDDGVERSFFAAGARELPPVGPDYYARRALGFEPDGKRREFKAIEAAVRARLGSRHPAGVMLLRLCRECQEVIDLLLNRGRREFSRLSRRLYDGPVGEGRRPAGSAEHPALRDAGPPGSDRTDEGPALEAGEAARVLAARLAAYFGGTVRVRVCAGLAANAAAGGATIKVRAAARLTAGEVRLLEVHEGWVHLGTTLNARLQPVCTFLGRGLPSATRAQEGLAVLTEVLAGAAHPGRLRRLAHRSRAVELAAAGADFLQVYRFLLEQGYLPADAYQQAARVFRGSLPRGCGPFVKDACYARGFREVRDFVAGALRAGAFRSVQLLFCGKTRLEDVGSLTRLAEEGLLARPRHLPPPFTDADALDAFVRGPRPGLAGVI
jgi:uncharacterized protein (TIGR02421 family)